MAGTWDPEEEERGLLHQELIETFGRAPQETTPGREGPSVETAPAEGV